MNNVIDKNYFKLKAIDIVCVIILFSVYSAALMVNNVILFLLVGLFIFCIYIKKILVSPAYIFSLYLLCEMPIAFSFGETNIPLLARTAILILYFFAFVLSIMNRRSYIYKQDWKQLAFIFVFVFLLFIEWIRAGLTENGLKFILDAFFLGFVPACAILLSLNKGDDFRKCIKFSQIIFISLLSTVFFIYFVSGQYIERIFEIIDPIGFSFLLVSNTIITCWFLRKTNPIITSLVVLMSLFLVVIIMQRSVLFAVAALLIYMLLVARISFAKKIIALGSVALAFIVYLWFSPGGILRVFRKLDDLFLLVASLSENINSISDSNVWGQLGTIGYRFRMWHDVIVNTNFFLGNGIGSFLEVGGYQYPHNIFFEFYWIFGFVGFLFVFVYIFIVLKKLFNKKIIYSDVGYMNGIIIVMLMISLFSWSALNTFIMFIIYSAIIFKYMAIHKNKLIGNGN